MLLLFLAGLHTCVVSATVGCYFQLGYTPLHQAAQQGHVLVINLLLKYKASPNAVTNVSCLSCQLYNILCDVYFMINAWCSFLHHRFVKQIENRQVVNIIDCAMCCVFTCADWPDTLVYCPTSWLHLGGWDLEAHHRGHRFYISDWWKIQGRLTRNYGGDLDDRLRRWGRYVS